MGRKNFNAYIKYQKAEKKRKQKQLKRKKREAKKKDETSGSLENMIAYVDKNGNIISEPPKENEGEEGQ